MSERSRHYILSDEGIPVPADLMTWAEWFETHTQERIVAQVYIGETQVSTVFMGLDHNWNPTSPYPLIYETMIFGGPHNLNTWRYPTRELAVIGHEEACDLVRKTEHPLQ